MSDTDLELLARYARHRAEDAFAELVRRHLDLVHSAALRQVRSPQLAEEVAQSAFLKLAQHARQLAPDTILSAWLYQVTRREAIDVVRREARRQLREQIATEMNAMNATDADWTHIEPMLDEAMHALDETDRAAVLLRYFENKSLREVGQALGASENAAQKRLTRAVERLREFFTKRGVTVGASGLVVVLSANAVQAAPVGLAVTISTATTLAGTAALATATATTAQAIAMTVIQKSLIAVTLVAAVGAGIYEAFQASGLRGQVLSLQQRQAPLSEQSVQLSRERDETARQLAMLREENLRLQAGAAEVLRLRAEMTRLRAAAQAAATVPDSPVTSAASAWLNRTQRLRARLDQTPQAKIPELQFATEDDWLNASKGKLDTEEDYRKALGSLRGAVENKFLLQLHAALKKFQANGLDTFPATISQLEPFFDPPIDPALLARWKVVPAREAPSLGLGGELIITQSPVDAEFDMQWGLGSIGMGSTTFEQRDNQNKSFVNMASVLESFLATGQKLTDPTQLQPFASTPEQRTMLEHIAVAFKSMAPEQQAETLRQFQQGIRR